MNVRFSTVAVALVTVSALLVFLATAVQAFLYTPTSEIEPPGQIPLVAATSSKPARLKIPSLDIDANVQYVGVNGKGEMGIPSNFKDVAWYRYGTIPGQLGSAVIAGHVDNGLGLPAVFWDLKDLKAGDDVYIVAEDGSRLHFLVSDVATYPYTDSPAERIFAESDKARLNLITCSGKWLPGKRTYSERLVIYTVFQGMEPPG